MKVRWMLAAFFCMALLPGSVRAVPRFQGSATMPSAALAQGHDWEHDSRVEGRNPGFRHGFRDGFEDGGRDREAGRKWHYGPGYKHPDRGYRNDFGDKRDYQREYREGYEKGYREAYGEHR